MNCIEIMGNLTKDPEIKVTQNGRCMARFTIAANKTFTSPDGEQKSFADFIPCVAWGELAEAVGNYLKKGKRVYAQGRYTSRKYQDQQGNDKYITEINLNFVSIPLPTRFNNNQQGNTQQLSNKAPEPQKSAFDGFGESYPDNEPYKHGDIPF